MRSRTAWVVSAALAVAVTAAVGGLVAWKAGSAPPSASAPVNVQTATVTRTQLSTTQTLSGTLGYGSAQPLSGSRSGIVTWLPASGVTVTRGQRLYMADDQPVPLFYGSTPLYRQLNAVGLVGPDVKVVAGNLAALGYDIGYQPPVGSVITQAGPTASPPASPLTETARAAGPTSPPATRSALAPAPVPSQATAEPSASYPAPTVSPTATPSAAGGDAKPTPTNPPTTPSPPAPVTATVRPGDAVLTTALVHAIARWQTAEGLPSTGTLGVGDVLVEPGPVQVTSLQAQLGGQAIGQLMTVASTAKTVTVAVDSTDVLSVRRSGKVTITLPDGSTTTGTITAIGTSVQSGQSTADGQPQQAVTIAPDHPSAVAGLTSAPVQVTFTGQTVTGVLAVPVTALLALSGGGYALQLPGGRLIPAQTGLFAQGMVQVSGPGITAGLRVVTSG